MTPIPELENLMKLIYELPWDNQGTPKGAVSIVTNGSLITDKHIELFKRYNVHVGLSCDGPPELNVYRGQNPFMESVTEEYNRKLVETMKKLRQNNVPVSVMCILHKGNAGSKEKRLKLGRWVVWLKEQGIMGGRMNPVYSDKHPELELSNDEVLQMWVNVYEWNRKHGLRWNPVIEMEKNVKRDKGGHTHFFPKPCVYHRCNPFNTHTLSIHPDGTVGCCDRTFARGLYVRSTDQNKCGRYEGLEQTECKGCKYWDICGGACPEEGIGGDWRRKTRFCDAIYRFYQCLEKKNNITFIPKEVTAVTETSVPHGDSPHGDNTHGDSHHGDSVHGDAPHADSNHGDNPDWRK